MNSYERESTGLGTAAMVCGILALVLSFIPIIGFLSWILAPLALIFGIIVLMRADASKGAPITGVATGSIALLICIGWVMAFGAAATEAAKNDPKVVAALNSDDPKLITQNEFSQIQNGMTYEQVVAIVGGEGEMSSDGSMGPGMGSIRNYGWKGNSLGANAQIGFVDGRVSSKFQIGLK